MLTRWWWTQQILYLFARQHAGMNTSTAHQKCWYDVWTTSEIPPCLNMWQYVQQFSNIFSNWSETHSLIWQEPLFCLLLAQHSCHIFSIYEMSATPRVERPSKSVFKWISLPRDVCLAFQLHPQVLPFRAATVLTVSSKVWLEQWK